MYKNFRKFIIKGFILLVFSFVLTFSIRSNSLGQSYDFDMDQYDTYIEEGKINEAEALLNQYINTHPDDGWGYYKRGELHKQEGDHYVAIDDFNIAINIGYFGTSSNSEYGWSYTVRGLCYYQLGNYNKVLEDLNAAISLGYSENGDAVYCEHKATVC